MNNSAIDALWLDTLHRICDRAAHELKGAMNGVSVNLEVVRSRAAKPETPSSAITQYANAAANQFDEVIDIAEALLALARPSRGPVDVGVTTRRVEALLGPAAQADGRVLTIDGSLEDLATTSALPSAVRLAIGASVLAAIESSGKVTCSAVAHRLVIASDDQAAIAPLPDDVMAAAGAARIEIQAEPSAISISFPP